MQRLSNWAGNYSYRARLLHQPATLEELQEIVGTRPRLRVLGSRHSFSDIADSDELVSLDRMPGEIIVNRDRMRVSVGGRVRYGELSERLEREGMALANLASLPHISVAGAVSTATHGSGDRNGNLATEVAGVELVTSDGSVRSVARGEPEFDGLVVGLGAVGALTRITLDVERTYRVRQRVFEELAWEALLEHFDAIFASGYSVSVFSRWGERAEQVWVKTRVEEEPEDSPAQFFGARAASRQRHPIVGLDPGHATPQLGSPGAWSERLPHFRLGFVPSAGDELQSEYIVPRRNAVAAIEAMLRIRASVAPLTQVSEIRTIAADSLWMSPQYGQDTAAIHFTWKPQPAAVARALVEVERALAPYQPRPHWGKLFLAGADQIAPLYERRGDFAALLERLDRRGKFRNDWLQERVLGSG